MTPYLRLYVIALVCLGLMPHGHAAIVAEYRMDEAAWNGTNDEIADSSGNGLHGTAVSATTTSNGLICNAADLLSTSVEDYLELNGQSLNGLNNFTISLWFQSTVSAGTSLFTARNTTVRRELLLQLRNSTRFRAVLKDQQDTLVRTGTLTDGAWHHVVWVRNGSSNCFYLDGAITECETLPTGALNVLSERFVVGQMYRAFNNFNFWPNANYAGLVDEFYIFDNALNATEVDQIYQNNNAGLNWDGSTRSCAAGPVLAPRAAYYFDEASWDGSTDEVIDSSGNGLHATSFSADTTDGLVCRAADLRNTTTADYVSLDYRAMDGVNDFTVGMWIRTTNTGNKALMSGSRAGEANELIFWFPTSTQFRPYFGTNSAAMTMPFVWDGNWHHLVWVRDGSDNCLYVDGNFVNCVTLTTATRNLDPNGLIVGQEQDVVGGSFVASQSIRGLVDELLIFHQALTAAEIDTIYQNNSNNLSWDGTPRLCPSLGAAEFRISHDGAGIYCASERVGVTALDASAATLTSYAENVVLDTGTGSGNWTVAIGSGNLIDGTPDDGIATYSFVAADNGEAWFDLSYPGGAPILDIEVEEQGNPSVRDNDTEGALVFAPTGFTITASALRNPPPSPVSDPLDSVTAGTDFDVYLTAFGTTDDDPVCGVIEDYTGVKNLEIWQDWVDPATGSIAATVAGTSVGSNEPSAANFNATFTNGQLQLSAKYKDAGRLQLNFKDGAMRGSTDAFVSIPAELRIIAVTDSSGTSNPGAGTATGVGFTAAGEGFNVTVDVLDAEGDRLPNYGLESAPEGIEVSSAQLVLPSTGGRHGSGDDGILTNGSAFNTTATPGRFENNTIYYDETGIIRLQARVADDDYLTAGPASGPLTGNVGRFYPDHFELTSSLLSLDCGTFAYMDAPSISLQANILGRTALGTTVENYDTTLVGSSGVAQLAMAAEAADDGNDLGARISFTPSTWVQGSYSLTDPDVSFTRAISPDGAYADVKLGLAINDGLDNRNLSTLDMDADSSGSCALAASCSAKDIGDMDIYYGRLAVLPAQGSELQDLDVDVEAQIYDAGAFLEHADDSCTSYIGSNVTLSNYRLNLDVGETTVISPLISALLDQGHTNLSQPLLLSAPGMGNEGMVNVSLAVPAWLQFDWNGSGDEDPNADATFGQYRGHDRIILWQQDP